MLYALKCSCHQTNNAMIKSYATYNIVMVRGGSKNAMITSTFSSALTGFSGIFTGCGWQTCVTPG